MKTKLIVSSGQYETAAVTITVKHKTWRGLCRRIAQLEREYAAYGDNHQGWITADIALASDYDEWGDNNIIGGRWCKPANGWLTTCDVDGGRCMTYRELEQVLYSAEVTA